MKVYTSDTSLKSKGFGPPGAFVKDILVAVDLFQMDFEAWEKKTG